MKKLPKIFKDKWLTALRSGEYKQGNGELHNELDDTYCCLGVGCIISGVPKAKLSSLSFPDEVNHNKVPKFLDVNSSALGFEEMWLCKLSKMNDGSGCVKYKSFKRIANWIEKNL